jgi:hypothetical protein
MSPVPLHEQQCKFKKKHHYVLAARCCWFQGIYKELEHAASGGLLCEVLEDKQRELPADLLNIGFQFRSLYTILQS